MSYVSVKRSAIHGTGIFAAKKIPKGTRILEYVGKKVTKKEAELLAETRYLFEFNSRYDIDGNVPENIARFVNHSCSPNCEVEIIRGKIFVIAKKTIKEGEELSYNYGYGLDEYEDYPCRCGAENCVGFIIAEEHWRKLRSD